MRGIGGLSKHISDDDISCQVLQMLWDERADGHIDYRPSVDWPDVNPSFKDLIYAVREDMYFPYLTVEIKCRNQALEFADRQNMHSMCISLRAVVNLAQAAGCAQEVHRRLLGFSISHDLEGVRIYGYYPEVSEDGIKYYRWEVKQFNIWMEEDKWACYSFVENLDRKFLPIHTNRLIHFLERIPNPQIMSFEGGVEYDAGSQASRAEVQEPEYSRAPSSRGLQPELHSMIQSLQQKLEEQKEREEKHRAQLEQQRAEQREREEKLLAQLEQQRAEQIEQEERLMSLLEQRSSTQSGVQ
jgi:hypothetical protein